MESRGFSAAHFPRTADADAGIREGGTLSLSLTLDSSLPLYLSRGDRRGPVTRRVSLPALLLPLSLPYAAPTVAA